MCVLVYGNFIHPKSPSPRYAPVSRAVVHITHDDRTGSDGLTGAVCVCKTRVYARTGQTWNKIINIKQYIGVHARAGDRL